MSIVTVVAKLVVRDDAIDTVKSELLKLIDPTMSEEGCIEYRLHQDNADPSVFIFYENWESMECFEKHMNTDHFKSYVNAVSSLVEEKVVHKMSRID